MGSLVSFSASKGGSASSAVAPEEGGGGGVDVSDEAEETELLLFCPPRSNDMVLGVLIGSEAVPPFDGGVSSLRLCPILASRVTGGRIQ